MFMAFLGETVIKEALDKWLKTVSKGSSKDVSSLYSKDGILVGTVAQKLKRGRGNIKSYFDHFLKKENLSGEIDTMEVQDIGCAVIVSGFYTFFWDEDGSKKATKARYTIVLRKRGDGTMEILHHHSSVQPEITEVMDIIDIFEF